MKFFIYLLFASSFFYSFNIDSTMKKAANFFTNIKKTTSKKLDDVAITLRAKIAGKSKKDFLTNRLNKLDQEISNIENAIKIEHESIAFLNTKSIPYLEKKVVSQDKNSFAITLENVNQKIEDHLAMIEKLNKKLDAKNAEYKEVKERISKLEEPKGLGPEASELKTSVASKKPRIRWIGRAFVNDPKKAEEELEGIIFS